MRIALGVEYDGSPFHGWQSQADGLGVQDALSRALAGIAGTPVTTIAAGRTDSGVHATMQVVHFDTEVSRPESAWVRGVNSALPAGIGVRWALGVDDAFHARFSASGRHYTYVLVNAPVRPVLLQSRVGWYHRPLALAAMCEAGDVLLGTHDFSAFRAAECQAKSPVKTLDRLTITREADILRIELHADAFLHHMVRNIVGALVRVGSGRENARWMHTLLASRDRAQGAPTFDASGLYFTGADYAPRWNLPTCVAPVRIVTA